MYRFCLSKNSEKFSEIYGEETNYFSRLSNIERKRWLVEETYNRKELGLQLIDESTYQRLQEFKTEEEFNISSSPFNYNILLNKHYC